MPQIIPRHQDYVISVGNVAAGEVVRNVLKELDTDAPFCLRGIAGWRADRNNLQRGKLRYTDEYNNWTTGPTELIGIGQFGSLPEDTGQQALPQPVRPQRVYQPGANVWIDFQNTSADNWTDVKILFRGAKLYQEGSIYSANYPPHYRSFPFKQALPLAFTLNIQTLRNEQIELKGGYDFVIQSLTFRELESSAAPVLNLGMKIKDHWGMSYQDDFVQIDWLASEARASRPGLLWPEIYMPANDGLFFDFERNDSGADTALALQVSFGGCRVQEVRL
jgi:hypothetical protein